MSKAQQLRGAAAITEMLDCIGACDASDRDVAKVLVEHELDIRELLAFALTEIVNQ